MPWQKIGDFKKIGKWTYSNGEVVENSFAANDRMVVFHNTSPKPKIKDIVIEGFEDGMIQIRIDTKSKTIMDAYVQRKLGTTNLFIQSVKTKTKKTITNFLFLLSADKTLDVALVLREIGFLGVPPQSAPIWQRGRDYNYGPLNDATKKLSENSIAFFRQHPNLKARNYTEVTYLNSQRHNLVRQPAITKIIIRSFKTESKASTVRIILHSTNLHLHNECIDAGFTSKGYCVESNEIIDTSIGDTYDFLAIAEKYGMPSRRFIYMAFGLGSLQAAYGKYSEVHDLKDDNDVKEDKYDSDESDENESLLSTTIG